MQSPRRTSRFPTPRRSPHRAAICRRPFALWLLLLMMMTAQHAIGILLVSAQNPNRHFEDFTQDPRWESYRSRLLPAPLPVTRQDFGWRPAGTAGRPDLGGWIQRSLIPAWVAKVIPKRTLHDRLAATGKFAVTRDESTSGVLFGWFNETSRGWRTPNSIVFRLDGNGGKFWVFYEYGTRHWLTGGGGCFEGDRYQTTTTKPFLADGTVHTWSLSYDPDGAEGNGLMTFVLDGKTYLQPLAPGHKADGAEFNRFGVFNQQSTGSGMDVSFHDLTLDGQPIDFQRDPGWEQRGSKARFADRHMRPFHDFGWLPTDQPNRPAGQLGGIIWRDERPAYYASKVDRLTLDNELFASGTITFNGAGSDSGVYLGWFDSNAKTNKTISDHLKPQKNMLAILLEGPSSIGHYFRAAYFTSTGHGVIQDNGPVIRPDGQVHRWSIHYLPQPGQSSGQVIVQLDDATATLPVSAEHRRAGASFDRFGLFNLQIGGHFVDVALDDVTFTVKPK